MSAFLVSSLKKKQQVVCTRRYIGRKSVLNMKRNFMRRNELIDEISDAVIDYFNTLPDGTEISTTDVVRILFRGKLLRSGRYRINGDIVDSFELHRMICKKAEADRITLDTARLEGLPIGLPYNISYAIRKM